MVGVWVPILKSLHIIQPKDQEETLLLLICSYIVT
jgi:hypothetical protein